MDAHDLTSQTPSALDTCVSDAINWLLAAQQQAGYWVGMLESNSCIEAEWLLAMHVLGITDHPLKPGLVRGILKKQRSDGSWEVFYDAPSGDINATVECYVALRAQGLAADDPRLVPAREWILTHGGLRGVRVFTRYWLALIGEWPWRYTPNVPPEIILLPRWVAFNIHNFASWARTTLVPISILSARQVVRRLPAESRLDELFPAGREHFDYTIAPMPKRLWSRKNFFRIVDRLLHGYQQLGFSPFRPTAITRAIEWIIRRQEADGAWGGIQPPWIYSLLALHAEGYALTHPVMAKGIATLEDHWSYERDGAIFIQACESPVWDTLLSVLALNDCGMDCGASSALCRAMDWILKQQVLVPGDWQVKVRDTAPGGWAFERANNHYPDVDDTALALIVLARLQTCFPDRERVDKAIKLARDWVTAMQCCKGGWAAFDKDNDKEMLAEIPFCDFGEALDPPSVDVTAHVLEGLGLLGMTISDPVIRKGLDYLRAEQESDGSWFGRWGVNHIYGTAAVLTALNAIGEDMHSAYVAKAARWIRDHQNTDGGWGESCASYMDDRLRGEGDSTPSQTGWALMGLLATESNDHRAAVENGVAFLVAKQTHGTWDEPQYTGTGFPGYGIGARVPIDPSTETRLHQGTELSRGFMINYNLYRHYFPLMALGRARRSLVR